jgi:hypothetical protein
MSVDEQDDNTSDGRTRVSEELASKPSPLETPLQEYPAKRSAEWMQGVANA